MINNYVNLDLYPDVRQTVADLKDYKLAILSNGSTTVLTTLVRNTDHDWHRLETGLQAEPRRLLFGRGAPRESYTQNPSRVSALAQ